MTTLEIRAKTDPINHRRTRVLLGTDWFDVRPVSSPRDESLPLLYQLPDDKTVRRAAPGKWFVQGT